MKTEISDLLKAFGSKIGLGSTLDLGDEGTIRLNLKESFGVDFQEDPQDGKLWIYCELFPGIDMTGSNHLFDLLRLMFTYHRTSDARLEIPPDGFQLFLISSFSLPTIESNHAPVDLLDEHLKNFVGLAETLRSSIIL